MNTLQSDFLALMEIREVFAKNLRLTRQSKGLSQEELAHLADIDRTYVSSLERGVYSPTLDVVERLAKALDTNAAELLKSRP
jgi:transcriptional regulator with XRE-family HTH domain